MSDPILKIQDATRSYGVVRALRGVSLEVHAGEVLALLGPNGAGKSTLLRAITTLDRLDEGSVQVCGHEVADDPSAVRNCLGYAGQEAALDKVLTGREFLRFQAGLVHLPKKVGRARGDELLARFDLTEAADRPVGGYSGGMKRRLELAAALMHKPQLLILDEPSAGLDYEARRELWHLLEELRAEGTALLLATHDFEEAGVLADRAVLMHHGSVVGAGTPDQLRDALGTWLLGAALGEHRRDEDHAKLAELFAPTGGTLVPSAPRDPQYVMAVAETGPDGADWTEWLRTRAAATGLELASVSLRRPTLQDAYLAATADQETMEVSR